MAGGLCARAFGGCTTTILEAASARCELMAGRTAPEAPGALRRPDTPSPDHRVAGAVRKGRACVDAAEGKRRKFTTPFPRGKPSPLLLRRAPTNPRRATAMRDPGRERRRRLRGDFVDAGLSNRETGDGQSRCKSRETAS